MINRKKIKKVVEKSFPEKQSEAHFKFVMSQGLLKSKKKNTETKQKRYHRKKKMGT
jgi:hypothetical protein